tara:strand:+ start:108 stop:998 length:891 start_codon:yes stop_codon:yes gene_type:complete
MSKDLPVTINLIDASFGHLETPDGFYSMAGHPNSIKKPTHVQYVRGYRDWEGITIFTDSLITPENVNSVNSAIKIGWLIERIGNIPQEFYDSVEGLDLIMTNDKSIIEKYPDKARFIPFGGGWIKKENQSTEKPKSRLVSMIYSSKKQELGHMLRHDIANNIPGLDLFGNGSPTPIEYKEIGLTDFMFTIVIENIRTNDYFTEKLIDPFLTGTIPIYWGCPNIGEYFNTDGMIILKNTPPLYDVEKIIKHLSVEKYKDMTDAMLDNFVTAKNYEIPEEWYYKNIIQKEYPELFEHE